MADTLDSNARLKWWVVGLPSVVLIYSAPILAPNWVPSFATSVLFFFYVLSVGAVSLVLGLLAAVAGALLIWRRARSRPGRSTPLVRRVFVAASLSLTCVAAVVASARIIPKGLPAGSYLASFDSATWCGPSAAWFVDGDITVRQKMLGDVVENVLPGRSRETIEALLGPSLDTAYFRETGRNLIYVLGPQRNSFFPIDSEWLLIWVDSEGRFERYGIYTD